MNIEKNQLSNTKDKSEMVSRTMMNRRARTAAVLATLVAGSGGFIAGNLANSAPSATPKMQEKAVVTLGEGSTDDFAAAGIVEAGMGTPNADATGIVQEIGQAQDDRYFKGQPVEAVYGKNFHGEQVTIDVPNPPKGTTYHNENTPIASVKFEQLPTEGK